MNPSHSVLIIEDDDATRDLLAAIATDYGFVPQVAADGETAMGQLAESDFEVVLIDLLLPRVDGFELLRLLKSKKPDLLERTIVVTAASEMSTRECVELRSVWRLMHKPVDVDALSTEMMSCAAEHASAYGCR
jgi:DNA-binding response OmpR family regulator